VQKLDQLIKLMHVFQIFIQIS